MKRPMKRHANTEGALADRGLLSEGEGKALSDERQRDYARTNEWGCTEKQEMFAQAVAKGATLADAYRASFNAVNMSQASIYTEASKMMDKPHVAERVKVLLAIRQERTFAVDAKRVRQHVFDRLMIESVEDESPPAARIRALELLGKIDVVSMFKEQKGPALDERADVTVLEAKLKAALERLVGMNAKVIEGNVAGIKATEDEDDPPRSGGRNEDE